jgi:predicted Zn-dependent protease
MRCHATGSSPPSAGHDARRTWSCIWARAIARPAPPVGNLRSQSIRRSVRTCILALAALLIVDACTNGNFSPQFVSDDPANLPPQIEREVGPVYTSPSLQAFVDRVGHKVAASSHLGGSFHFIILDDPVPNALAVAPDYVFVTRGMLSLIDDEAELAAAFGHELGHIELHHAAKRQRLQQELADASANAASTSGSAAVGRLVDHEGLLALRRYSRDQELQADRAGLGYLVRAGYRGDAMATLIEKLRLESGLENEILGPPPEGGDRGALATHPDPVRRLAALRKTEDLRKSGSSGRQAYLAAIEDMSVDDPPEEGFVRGPTFEHPIRSLAFSALPDFTLFNDHDGVLGVGGARSFLFFSCSDEEVPDRLVDWMRNELKPTPSDIHATEIDGAEAAVGSRAVGSDTGLAQIRYILIRHGTGICYFNLLSDGTNRDRRMAAMVGAARSFHSLSDTDVAALRPLRLHVVSTAGESAAALAARLPYPDHRMQRLLTLNGVDQPDALMRLPQIKTIVP